MVIPHIILHNELQVRICEICKDQSWLSLMNHCTGIKYNFKQEKQECTTMLFTYYHRTRSKMLSDPKVEAFLTFCLYHLYHSKVILWYQAASFTSAVLGSSNSMPLLSPVIISTTSSYS